MRKRLKTYIYLLTAITGILFWSCSQHSTRLTSIAFHNTAARYNAFFLANQKLLEVENEIRLAHADDYNQVLKIHYNIDTTLAKSYSDKLKYAEERA